MKQSASKNFYAHWENCRGRAAAPDRNEFTLDPIRHLLADSFVIAWDPARGHPFRFAGTRVCALFGRDLKGSSFADLWRGEHRLTVEEFMHVATEETIGTVAGIRADLPDASATMLELLILPFRRESCGPVCVTGLLVPTRKAERLDEAALGITSWRHLAAPAPIFPRMVRKLQLARGFFVYEGRA